jgi:hypothetical protein
MSNPVAPANAGACQSKYTAGLHEIPASAGMTEIKR